MYFDCPLVDLHGADYSILYVDPPWTYRDTCNAGARGAAHKYDLLTFAQLCDMRTDIRAITAPDSLCFMWATYPQLPEALSLLSTWGYEYRTTAFTWVKLSRKSPPLDAAGTTLHWGMGSYTRANAEIVLFGRRGHVSRVSAGVHSIIASPVQTHSRKPDACKQRIVDLVGSLPRLELFARGEPGYGFDGWGNTPVYTPEDTSSPI